MNPLPFVTDETVASKRNGLRRAQQVNEADEIYTSLVLQRGLLRDLIHTSATGISDPAEAADVRLDLYTIVRDLAAAGGPGNPEPIWQNYKHHFVGDRNRHEFFKQLRHLTRRVTSTMLVKYPKPE